MQHRRILRAAFVGSVALAIALGKGIVADEPKQAVAKSRPAMADRIDEILWWLPADTKTLIVNQGPSAFSITSPSTLAGIVGPRGSRTSQIAGQKVILQVEGARRVRPPKEGPGTSCRTKEKPSLSSNTTSTRGFRERYKRKPTSRRQSKSTKVFIFKRRFEGDDWTLYICQPRPNLLVGTTHRGYLSDLLTRIGKRGPTRGPLPADLPETGNTSTGPCRTGPSGTTTRTTRSGLDPHITRLAAAKVGTSGMMTRWD